MNINWKEIIKENKKTIIILGISTILTILAIIISNIYIQPKIFNMELAKNRKMHIGIECIFALAIFMIFIFIIKFIDRIYHKDKFYQKWLISFIIYATIMAVFLLIIWPGHWAYDEFFIMESALNTEINIWQSFITVIYMALPLMIIPYPVGIVIIQAIIISAIVSYIYTKISMRYHKKLINIVFFIFMITPAILINNLYPLRLQMYSYIMLLFFTILIFDKIENNKLTILKLIKLYILIALLILWRSEGILFIILAPILMLFVYKVKDTKINIIGVITLLIINVVILFAYKTMLKLAADWVPFEEDRYGLTIYINPLSEMLQKDIKGKNLEKNLEDIDKVLSIEELKKHPSFLEIPSFWESDSLIREDFQKHLSEFKKSYIELVANNLGIFLEARMKTFLSTCTMYDTYSGTSIGHLVEYYGNPNYSSGDTVEKFLNNYKYTKAINKDLKVNVETLLIGENPITHEHNKAIGMIFWNPLIQIILVIVCAIISLVKKDWIYLGIFVTLIGNAGIVFLTAPANYFMYYLPVYISGTIIPIIYTAELINKKKNEDKNENISINTNI